MLKMIRTLAISTLAALASATTFAQASATDPVVNVGGTRCKPGGESSKGINMGVGSAMSGLYITNWCKDVKGQWWLQVNVVSAADVANFGAMAKDWAAALNADDYDAAMGAWRSKWAAQTGDPYLPKFKSIWYPDLAAIMALKPADAVVTPPPPPPPVVLSCVVAPNGVAKTRQWYPFANGARTSTVGGGSVTIAGTACKLDVATATEGTTIYGAFGTSFRADRVTVCSCQ